jgi:N-acetylmuramoyl-L-alanine amidase
MMALPPSLGRTPRIERHAGRIHDPVARLRFLRKAASPRPHHVWIWFLRTNFTLRWHPRWQIRYLGWAALVLTLAIVPSPIPNGTAGMFVRERRLVSPASEGTFSLPTPVPQVWMVEHSDTSELYSNGLRIDSSFTVPNRPRAQYPIFALHGAAWTDRTGSKPIGIVFHTTESHLAPFEEDENHRLKQIGRNLLEVIRQQRSYHYVIDRFGRVYRVVDESDAANHAGNSVWADTDGIYVNLNDSFLGVAFEAQTGATNEVTPAQISSGKVLTEMLRSRYGISAENCVTHAQVSVNPLNMRIGAHTDWAYSFPFAKLGLPDNYAIPLPSLYAFGFVHDEVFLESAGGRWRGLDLAIEQVERQAAAEKIPAARYRAILRHRYKEIAAVLKEENEQDSAPSSAAGVSRKGKGGS